MKLLRMALLLPLALALQAMPAHADSASRLVGGASFDFSVPAGFCVMEDDNSRDAIFINTISTLLRNSGNTLILLTVECGRRKTWRNGVAGQILDYATYYIPTNMEAQTLSGETQELRETLCADMRKQGDATLEGTKDIVAKSAKELNTNIAINSTKYIGVIDQDPHGCYAALLVGVRGAAGKNVLMSVLINATVIRGKSLFFALYHEFKGPETTQQSLEQTKTTAVTLDAHNP